MVQNNDLINKQKYYIKQLVQSNKKIKKHIFLKQTKTPIHYKRPDKMYLCQKPLGYVTCQISHNQPQQQIPIPKTLNDKKDTTLIEMTMKMFIKQRLYGELQGFYKAKRMNKNIFKDFQANIQNNHKVKQTNQQRYQDQSYGKRRSMYSRVTSAQKMSKLQIQNLEKLKRRQILQKSQPINKVKKRILNNNNVRKHSLSLDISQLTHRSTKRQESFDTSYQKVNFPTHRQASPANISSFISQVQIQTQRNYLKQPLIILPQISTNKKSIPLQMNKQLKSLIKKQLQPKIVISQQIWTYLTSSNIIKPTKTNNSGVYQQATQFNLERNNFKINNHQKNNNQKNNNQKIKESGLKKDRILTFIRTQSFVVTQFIQPIINFFQLNIKFQDKITKIDLQTIFLNLYNQSPRAWAICIFRILDKKKDGKIDSTDLFKFHNYVDELLIAYETKKAQSSLNKDFVVQKNLLNQQSILQDIKSKRQKTQISSVSNYQLRKQKLANKSQIRKPTLRNATNQSEFDLQYNQIQTFLSAKNNENMIQLKRQIQKLNQHIISYQGHPYKNTLNNPQDITHQNNLSLDEFTYLQQALLKTAQLKISDLCLIIPNPSNQLTPKQAIQIDTRKLNIKLSSVYVQTFSVTEHNQQTRIDREYVQGLKDKIRKQRRESLSQQNGLEIQALRAIQYSQFYQSNMWQKFKELFFLTFHALLIENKKI